MRDIIIATSNKGKIREFKLLLEPLGFNVYSMNEVIKEELNIVENGTTFKENALIKANSIFKFTNKIVLADDSGLEIEALDGKPGIESARFLGQETPYNIKNNHILEIMKNQENRKARFICAIALLIPNQRPICVEASFEGEIALEIKGTEGFGYDPIFYIPKLGKTAAQMTVDEKNTYSHRAKALNQIINILKENKGE